MTYRIKLETSWSDYFWLDAHETCRKILFYMIYFVWDLGIEIEMLICVYSECSHATLNEYSISHNIVLDILGA